MDKRQHVRVSVQFRNHFSSESRMVAGEGELRDLPPEGCRVTSPVAAPLGAELECCIFPGDEGNPFIIEGATVRWARPLEVGLAFTKIRPGVQRQIAQLCRKRAPLASVDDCGAISLLDLASQVGEEDVTCRQVAKFLLSPPNHIIINVVAWNGPQLRASYLLP